MYLYAWMDLGCLPLGCMPMRATQVDAGLAAGLGLRGVWTRLHGCPTEQAGSVDWQPQPMHAWGLALPLGCLHTCWFPLGWACGRPVAAHQCWLCLQEEVLDAIWPPHTPMDLDAMLPATPFAAAMVRPASLCRGDIMSCELSLIRHMPCMRLRHSMHYPLAHDAQSSASGGWAGSCTATCLFGRVGTVASRLQPLSSVCVLICMLTRCRAQYDHGQHTCWDSLAKR